jgi:hypothetical protein
MWAYQIKKQKESFIIGRRLIEWIIRSQQEYSDNGTVAVVRLNPTDTGAVY